MKLIKNALLCILPVSIVLFIGWNLLKGFLDIIPYAYGLFWALVIFGALLPFLIQLLLWKEQRKLLKNNKIPIHPSGIMIPIGIILFFLFCPVAEKISRIYIPSYCNATYSELVCSLPEIRGYSDEAIPTIALKAMGKGNKKHVSFTGGSIVLDNINGIKDLSFDFGQSVFYYSNKRDKNFPFSENFLQEYFENIPESTKSMTGVAYDVWTRIQTIKRAQSEKDLNSLNDSSEGEFWFYVEDQSIFKISFILTLIVSFLIAIILSFWYFYRLGETTAKDRGAARGSGSNLD